MPFVHSHLAVMPDVHVGMGATVGSVIATQGRDHSGRGRRRHRLRHDGGADLAEGERPAGLAGGAARAHRARGAARLRDDAWPRTTGDPGATAPDSVRHALARARGAVRRHRGEASEAQAEEAAEAAGNARRRQPLHRGLSRYRADRVGDAALRLARHRQPDRPALHRAGAAGHEEALHQPAGPRPGVSGRRHRALRRLRRGDDLGAGLRGREPPRDDGRGAARAARGAAAVRAGRGGGELPPQLLRRASGTSAKTCS